MTDLADIQAKLKAAMASVNGVVSAAGDVTALLQATSDALAEYVAAQQPPPVVIPPPPIVVPPPAPVNTGFSPPDPSIVLIGQTWTISSDGTGTVLLNGALPPSKELAKTGATKLWTDGTTLYAWAPVNGTFVGWKWLGGVYWGQDYDGVMKAAMIAAGLLPPTPPKPTQNTPPTSAGTAAAPVTVPTNPSPTVPSASVSPNVIGLPTMPALPALVSPVTVPTTGRALVMTHSDGTQLLFDEGKATILADTPIDPAAPNVQTHVRRVFDPISSFTVEFRPEVDGSREEVVIKLGQVGQGYGASVAANNQPAVNVTTPIWINIYKDGVKIGSRHCPTGFYWWAKIRWFDKQRPVVVSAATVMNSKSSLLPLSTKWALGAPIPGPVSYIGGMGEVAGVNTGIMCAMQSVGGQSYLGPYTEHQVAYLLYGDQGCLNSMFVQAEAVGLMPIHWTDKDGSPFSIFKNPLAEVTSIIFNQGRKAFTVPFAPGNTDAGWFNYDPAHAPNLLYIPWLLTRDPFYLELMQAQVTYTTAWTGQYSQNPSEGPGVMYDSEPRGLAWNERAASECWFASPPAASCPTYLLPKEFYKQVLDANLTHFCVPYMSSPAAVAQRFHAMPWSSSVPVWEMGYMYPILSQMVRMGLTDWQPMRDWVGFGIALFVNGTGWDRRVPTGAGVGLVKFQTTNNPGGVPGGTVLGLIKDTSWDGQTYADMATCSADYLSIAHGGTATEAGNPNLDLKMTDPLPWPDELQQFNENQGPDYLLIQRGTAELMKLDGIANLADGSDWMNAKIQRFLNKISNGRGNQMRYAFDNTVVQEAA